MYIVLANRTQLMPGCKGAGDDQSDGDADGEEQAVGWQGNQQDGNYCNRDDQPGRSSRAETLPRCGFGRHKLILPPD